MVFNKYKRIAENPSGADKSAVGAINRPLRGVGAFYSLALSKGYVNGTAGAGAAC